MEEQTLGLLHYRDPLIHSNLRQITRSLFNLQDNRILIRPNYGSMLDTTLEKLQ